MTYVRGLPMSLRLQVRQDLQTIQSWVPGFVIQCSEMLPRRVWCGAVSPRCMDLARRKINMYMRGVVRSMGGDISFHLNSL